jgi:hypothetical protein
MSSDEEGGEDQVFAHSEDEEDGEEVEEGVGDEFVQLLDAGAEEEAGDLPATRPVGESEENLDPVMEAEEVWLEPEEMAYARTYTSKPLSQRMDAIDDGPAHRVTMEELNARAPRPAEELARQAVTVLHAQYGIPLLPWQNVVLDTVPTTLPTPPPAWIQRAERMMERFLERPHQRPNPTLEAKMEPWDLWSTRVPYHCPPHAATEREPGLAQRMQQSLPTLVPVEAYSFSPLDKGLDQQIQPGPPSENCHLATLLGAVFSQSVTASKVQPADAEIHAMMEYLRTAPEIQIPLVPLKPKESLVTTGVKDKRKRKDYVALHNKYGIPLHKLPRLKAPLSRLKARKRKNEDGVETREHDWSVLLCSGLSQPYLVRPRQLRKVPVRKGDPIPPLLWTAYNKNRVCPYNNEKYAPLTFWEAEHARVPYVAQARAFPYTAFVLRTPGPAHQSVRLRIYTQVARESYLFMPIHVPLGSAMACHTTYDAYDVEAAPAEAMITVGRKRSPDELVLQNLDPRAPDGMLIVNQSRSFIVNQQAKAAGKVTLRYARQNSSEIFASSTRGPPPRRYEITRFMNGFSSSALQGRRRQSFHAVRHATRDKRAKAAAHTVAFQKTKQFIPEHTLDASKVASKLPPPPPPVGILKTTKGKALASSAPSQGRVSADPLPAPASSSDLSPSDPLTASPAPSPVGSDPLTGKGDDEEDDEEKDGEEDEDGEDEDAPLDESIEAEAERIADPDQQELEAALDDQLEQLAMTQDESTNQGEEGGTDVETKGDMQTDDVPGALDDFEPGREASRTTVSASSITPFQTLREVNQCRPLVPTDFQRPAGPPEVVHLYTTSHPISFSLQELAQPLDTPVELATDAIPVTKGKTKRKAEEESRVGTAKTQKTAAADKDCPDREQKRCMDNENGHGKGGPTIKRDERVMAFSVPIVMAAQPELAHWVDAAVSPPKAHAVALPKTHAKHKKGLSLDQAERLPHPEQTKPLPRSVLQWVLSKDRRRAWIAKHLSDTDARVMEHVSGTPSIKQFLYISEWVRWNVSRIFCAFGVTDKSEMTQWLLRGLEPCPRAMQVCRGIIDVMLMRDEGIVTREQALVEIGGIWSSDQKSQKQDTRFLAGQGLWYLRNRFFANLTSDTGRNGLEHKLAKFAHDAQTMILFVAHLSEETDPHSFIYRAIMSYADILRFNFGHAWSVVTSVIKTNLQRNAPFACSLLVPLSHWFTPRLCSMMSRRMSGFKTPKTKVKMASEKTEARQSVSTINMLNVISQLTRHTNRVNRHQGGNTRRHDKSIMQGFSSATEMPTGKNGGLVKQLPMTALISIELPWDQVAFLQRWLQKHPATAPLAEAWHPPALSDEDKMEDATPRVWPSETGPEPQLVVRPLRRPEGATKGSAPLTNGSAPLGAHRMAWIINLDEVPLFSTRDPEWVWRDLWRIKCLRPLQHMGLVSDEVRGTLTVLTRGGRPLRPIFVAGMYPPLGPTSRRQPLFVPPVVAHFWNALQTMERYHDPDVGLLFSTEAGAERCVFMYQMLLESGAIALVDPEFLQFATVAETGRDLYTQPLAHPATHSTLRTRHLGHPLERAWLTRGDALRARDLPPAGRAFDVVELHNQAVHTWTDIEMPSMEHTNTSRGTAAGALIKQSVPSLAPDHFVTGVKHMEVAYYAERPLAANVLRMRLDSQTRSLSMNCYAILNVERGNTIEDGMEKSVGSIDYGFFEGESRRTHTRTTFATLDPLRRHMANANRLTVSNRWTRTVSTFAFQLPTVPHHQLPDITEAQYGQLSGGLRYQVERQMSLDPRDNASMVKDMVQSADGYWRGIPWDLSVEIRYKTRLRQLQSDKHRECTLLEVRQKAREALVATMQSQLSADDYVEFDKEAKREHHAWDKAQAIQQRCKEALQHMANGLSLPIDTSLFDPLAPDPPASKSSLASMDLPAPASPLSFPGPSPPSFSSAPSPPSFSSAPSPPSFSLGPSPPSSSLGPLSFDHTLSASSVSFQQTLAPMDVSSSFSDAPLPSVLDRIHREIQSRMQWMEKLYDLSKAPLEELQLDGGSEALPIELRLDHQHAYLPRTVPGIVNAVVFSQAPALPGLSHCTIQVVSPRIFQMVDKLSQAQGQKGVMTNTIKSDEGLTDDEGTPVSTMGDPHSEPSRQTTGRHQMMHVAHLALVAPECVLRTTHRPAAHLTGFQNKYTDPKLPDVGQASFEPHRDLPQTLHQIEVLHWLSF